MFQRVIRMAVYVLFFGSVSGANAQVDMPKIAKGQLLPAPKVARMIAGSVARSFDISKVFEENFETGASSWTKAGSWAIGTPTTGPSGGHSSLNCAGTNLSGYYQNNANDRLISPTIALPVLTHPSDELKINFWEWFSIESGYDHGIVEISTDGGTSWQQLDDRSGSSGWRQSSIDISAYAGQSVQLGFHFTSDGSVTSQGWFIDDVEVTKQEPQPLTATLSSLNQQKFPFVYMNIAVDTFDVGYPGLTQSAFRVLENGVLQTDHFEVTPPDVGGGARLADIVFLMDNSGSMSDDQNAVYSNLISFVNALSSSGIDFALGLCRYGASESSGYPIVEDGGILTSDANYFKNTVWLRNRTDGDYEPGWDAMYSAANRFNFRPGSQKIFVLITDESPNYVTGGASSNYGVYTKEETQSLLRSQTVTLFALIPLVPAVIQDYGSIAEATNGKYFDINSPFDEILTYIESQVSNTYLVRYRSSNPALDGTLRTVEIDVSYGGNAATCNGSYTPGSTPVIQRTQATLDLHTRAWAEGSSFVIEADIVDNVAPYVQSATLYYRKTGTVAYNSTPMSVNSGDSYRGTIPATAVSTPGVDYYISATDGQNTASDPSVNPTNDPYQLAILPNVAPAITHQPPANLTPGHEIQISAQIVDNTNVVAIAKLYFRKTGQLIYQSSDLAKVSVDGYQGSIPSGYVTNDGVEYYLRAEDDFGVSGYFGEPDSPSAIKNPMAYVDEKESIIEYFRAEDFYTDAENEAENYADGIAQKVTAATVTNKDVEALRRLILVEEAAKVAYPGAERIAQLSSKATLKFSVAFILAAAFGDLEKALTPLKDVPVLNWFYDSAKEARDLFAGFNSAIVKHMVGSIAGRLWPRLMEWFPGLSQPEALSAADKIAWTIAPKIEKEMLKWNFSNLVSFQPIEDGLRDVYLSVYEKGLPGGLLWVGGTERAIIFSVGDAKAQDFDEGNINVLTQSIRNFKEPEIAKGNSKVEAGISAKIDWAGKLGIIKLVLIAIAIVGSIATIIAGIIGCGPSAGIGCILSAIGGAGLFVAVKAIIPFFSVAEIGLYGWGMAEGTYQLHYISPRQIMEVRELAFQESTRSSREGVVSSNRGALTFAALPNDWADSLALASDGVAQTMSQIKLHIQQGQWDEAGAAYERVLPKIDALLGNERIANGILDASYIYNNADTMSELDSIYNYTAAYAAANDIGLGFSQFAIGWALLAKPQGSDLDTLGQILDESIKRLQEMSPAYRQTFIRFNSWGFQVPPIVCITTHSIEENTGVYTVRARIRNTSKVAVHNVNVKLMSYDSIGVSIIAETDTLLPVFDANEELESIWRVDYRGQEDNFILDLRVQPLSSPGDFQGDRSMISQSVLDATPKTPGTLNNKNIYAYPNPFNPERDLVTFRFKLSKDGNVDIRVYDASRALVATVASGIALQANTESSIKWNGKNDKGEMVANGVYFYVIESSSGERGIGKVAALR